MNTVGDDRIRSFLADEALRALTSAPSLDEAVGRLAPRVGARPSGPQRLIVLLAAALLLVAALGTAIAVASGILRLPLVIDDLETEPPSLAVPLVGPAGNGAIALGKDGDIFIADRPGGDLRPLVADPEFDQEPIFSPGGTKLAFMRSVDGRPDQSGLMVADADGTNVVQLTPKESLEGGWKWSFAPDGRSLIGVARIDGENRVVLVSVDPGAAATVLDIRLPRSSMDIDAPRFRPTNPMEVLVVAQPDPDGPRGLYLYDLATRGIRTIVESDDVYVSDVAWFPDGKHITYSGRIVAADGSGDQALDAMEADQISPLSNDGTRIVLDVPEVDGPGDDSNQRSVVVSIDGELEPIELACGRGMTIECAWSWVWSPDDSMLLGTIPHETSTTYLQADPDSGHVTVLDWGGGDPGTPAWQRVAP